MSELKSRDARLRRFWDKQSKSYDRQMGFMDRRFFRDTRAWICRQAAGETLEVAIGTGLNLPHYPAGVRLTGVEWSPEMLDRARRRATDLGRDADLQTGDAQSLPFPDASFDTVVCTFSLCAIPDDRRAVGEMVRVVRPGGLLLLADHVEATSRIGRLLQRSLELYTVRFQGEYWRRRPIRHVQALGPPIEHHDGFSYGAVERFAARVPG
ncbi:class I SAM-dependent methyltransferase [Cryptosporangium sp. NPDC051539]|uniref:class I SAM-dependent methyltransferase n=1 Tax=Cryptosporangium sp. NPDC051539 TaxID=3363962 RepID=UPI0037ADD4CA